MSSRGSFVSVLYDFATTAVHPLRIVLLLVPNLKQLSQQRLLVLDTIHPHGSHQGTDHATKESSSSNGAGPRRFLSRGHGWLQNSQTLEHLKRAHNEIADTGPMSDTLVNNSALLTLVLSYNKNTNTGIRGLARALYHDTHSECLSLGWNQMTDDAGSCLVLVLSHNPTVGYLSITGNDMSGEMIHRIEEFPQEERRRGITQRLSTALLEFEDSGMVKPCLLKQPGTKQAHCT